MRAIETTLPGVVILQPTVHADTRGFFYEAFNQRVFDRLIGTSSVRFVQDNHSRSAKGVLRGLHYQVTQGQGKLVRCPVGEVFDVAVDLRRGSPDFGRWVATRLSADNRLQLWIPAGFAHGFLTTSDFAEVQYKTTDYYAPQHERCIRWDDPDIDVDWPLDGAPILSEKDRRGVFLRVAECPACE